jgi:hypothetical protein
MSDKENDVDSTTIDPPENTGGGTVTEPTSGTEPIDPPENTGGGSGT